MLTKDQKERVSLIKTMCAYEISKKEALEALELNRWDTAMALEWIEAKRGNPDKTIEEFQQDYAEARKQSVVLPQDRYDLEPKKEKAEPTNRQQRRAEKKRKKKEK